MSIRLSYISIGILIVVFSILRLYSIQDSLLFFSDMGRDFLVFQKWQVSGKPPLLGPQNSALPFNQSPIYFYYLYIFYLLTNHSLYATIIAGVVFHIFIMLGGCFLLHKYEELHLPWVICWILLTINPQMVMQHRYIWNPSFVAGCLVLAFFSFLIIRKKFSWKLSFIFSGSLALANGFSYSAAPTIILFMLFIPFFLSTKVYAKLLVSLVISLTIVNAPLIFFEVRHNFTLTKLMLHYDKIEQAVPPFSEKVWAILSLSFSMNHYKLLFILAVIFSAFFMYRYKKSEQKDAFFSLGFTSVLFLASLLVLAIVPVSVQPHYIFGVISFFAIMIAFLGRKTSILATLILLGIWGDPNTVQSYFTKAWRTVQETEDCSIKVCSIIKQPTFVSLQSTYHDYHTGTEYRYLFGEHGCKIFDIEQSLVESSNVNTMLVVSEQVDYQHDKTSFNELTLFGNSQMTNTIECSPDLKIHVLTRN